MSFGRYLLVFQRLYFIQKCALLGYNAGVVVISYRRFRTYRSPLQGGGIHKGLTLDKTFYNLLFKYEAVGTPVDWNIFSYLIPRWGLYIIIRISIKAILLGRFKDLIFLFKIPIGTWKNFYEIYKQFGHVPSKSFASPPLECWTLRNKVLRFFKNIPTTSPVTQHYIPEGRIIQQWMMFMNILIFISDRLYCLCLLRAAEADAQRHIKKHTIWQLTNEQSDSSQFTVSLHTEENNWHSLRLLIEPESCCTPTASSQTY